MPKPELAFLPAAREIAKKYEPRDEQGCSELYGPLVAKDIRELMFYRIASFQTSRSKRGYEVYVNNGQNNKSLCGMDRIGCGKVFLCLAPYERIFWKGAPVRAMSQRVRDINFRDGFRYRINTCRQLVTSGGSVSVFPLSQEAKASMKDAAVQKSLMVNALFYHSRICADDQAMIWGVGGVTSELSGRRKEFNPFSGSRFYIYDQVVERYEEISRDTDPAFSGRVYPQSSTAERVALIEYRNAYGRPRGALYYLDMPQYSDMPHLGRSPLKLRANLPFDKIKYSAEVIRAWNRYDQAEADFYLNIYRGELLSAARILSSSGVMGWINTLGAKENPDAILEKIEQSLIKFIESSDSLSALSPKGLAPQDREHGKLAILHLLNAARSQNQHARMAYDELRQDGFARQSKAKSQFHSIGYDPEEVEKWVHPDGREYVYLIKRSNPTGLPTDIQQIFDGTNDGTFNYCGGASCHFVLDVLPWVLWGATLDDQTTPQQRAIAFRDAFNVLTQDTDSVSDALTNDS